jgi:hypothetical protein
MIFSQEVPPDKNDNISESAKQAQNALKPDRNNFIQPEYRRQLI